MSTHYAGIEKRISEIFKMVQEGKERAASHGASVLHLDTAQIQLKALETHVRGLKLEAQRQEEAKVN